MLMMRVLLVLHRLCRRPLCVLLVGMLLHVVLLLLPVVSDVLMRLSLLVLLVLLLLLLHAIMTSTCLL